MIKTLVTYVALPALCIIIFMLIALWICKMLQNNVQVGSPFKETKTNGTKSKFRRTSLPFNLGLIMLILVTEINCVTIPEKSSSTIKLNSIFFPDEISHQFETTMKLGNDDDLWELYQYLEILEQENLTSDQITTDTISLTNSPEFRLQTIETLTVVILTSFFGILAFLCLEKITEMCYKRCRRQCSRSQFSEEFSYLPESALENYEKHSKLRHEQQLLFLKTRHSYL
jgi:hypothetical protein